MSVTGALRVGRRVRLGGSEGRSSCHASVVSSAISTNSRSSIFFTTLCGRTAVGLYGPGVDRLASDVSGAGLATLGTDVAAAASSSSPFGVVRLGLNVGRVGRVNGEGSEPKPLEPGLMVEMELAE